MSDITDSEGAFIEWLAGDPDLPAIHATSDSDGSFLRVYRIGGPTDPGTFLDHPEIVVSAFGSLNGDQSKAAVATTAISALARALSIRGQTVAGTVVTDVVVGMGLQSLPEPDDRWHYQFSVHLTTHPARS